MPIQAWAAFLHEVARKERPPKQARAGSALSNGHERAIGRRYSQLPSSERPCHDCARERLRVA
jgi:hypothetical protein